MTELERHRGTEYIQSTPRGPGLMRGRSNSGEEAGKALWVWSGIRVFAVGGGAPLLANPVLQSSGAPTLDTGLSGTEVGLPVESHSFCR